MAVTRKATVPNPGLVRVNPKKGEYLHFRLEAAGPVPIFAFSSSVTGTLRKAPDFPGYPKKLYEWEHLKNPSEIQRRELLDLLMAFTTSADYSYFVEIRKGGGTSLKTVLDVKFTSDDPKDTASESFNVVTPREKP
jgi:hypothetical protein